MRKVNTKEKGFSIIEVLVVCVIIGIVAAVAIPHLQKALRAAEGGNTIAAMRTISSTQVGFFSSNNRFGRLGEINNVLSNAIGTTNGNTIEHGKYLFEMTPAAPTDAELREGFTITATRDVAGETVIYKYELTEAGEIRQILP